MRTKRNSFFLGTTVLLLLFWFSAFSQGKQKSFKKTLKEANNFFETEDYKSAEELYISIWQQDSTNAKLNLKLAISRYKQKKFPQEIIPYLLKAEKGGEELSHYYLGRTYHQALKFGLAIEQYNKYKTVDEAKREFKNEEIKRAIETANTAKNQMQQPHKAWIKNVGSTINTKYPEYVPLITPDERDMYFTSRRPGSTGEQKDVFGNYYEDVYVSHRSNEGWTKPENLGKPINTDIHDACVSLSPDGQKMLLFRTSKDLASGDLYSTNWTGEAWEAPVMLGPEINSEAKELSACTNHKSTMLIFSSDREGGLGGRDLYRVNLLPNGKWSMPVNLGPTINTKYDEDAPFISPNEQYLYFSSNGINTMGGYDIYRSDIFVDYVFGEPQNLGSPINSVGDDIFFVISADARHGYFSSRNEDVKDPNYLSQDIFLVDMRYGENETCVKRGICVFLDSLPSLNAQITVYDEVTEKITGIYKPSDKDGTFIFTVNPYDRYKIVAEAKGYQSVTLRFKPLVEQEDYEVDTDIFTIELKTNDE